MSLKTHRAATVLVRSALLMSTGDFNSSYTDSTADGFTLWALENSLGHCLEFLFLKNDNIKKKRIPCQTSLGFFFFSCTRMFRSKILKYTELFCD